MTDYAAISHVVVWVAAWFVLVRGLVLMVRAVYSMLWGATVDSL